METTGSLRNTLRQLSNNWSEKGMPENSDIELAFDYISSALYMTNRVVSDKVNGRFLC